MRDVAALESLVRAREEFAPLPVEKPCIAVFLDGFVGGEHHKLAYLIAMEWRRLEVSEQDAVAGLEKWAKNISQSRTRFAEKAVRSAYQKLPNGNYRWKPPGLFKKGAHGYLLQPTCDLVGCPANCPAYLAMRGNGAEDYKRFCLLGWPAILRSKRRYAAVEVYRAICAVEEERDWRAGTPLRVAHQELSDRSKIKRRTVGRCLPHLREAGLIEYKEGTGSGPHARDRSASLVRRVIPIPSASSYPAITTGGQESSHIGGVRTQPKVEGSRHLRVSRQ